MFGRRLTEWLLIVLLLALADGGPTRSEAAVKAQRHSPMNAATNRPLEAIVIDHNTTDLDAIPEYWIQRAKAELRVAYGHTSHGSQPITGMAVLQADPSTAGLYDFVRSGEVVPGVLSIADSTPSGDLGNPDRVTWAQRTREYLDATGSDRNVMIWSWCGQVSTASEEDIETYLTLMSELEAEFPLVSFVYMTGHLDGSGEDGNLNRRNNQIRQFCRENGKVLFDFADIESYDPDGFTYVDLGADDGCSYSGGNWAQEWCAENASNPLCAACSCAHSQPLNCNLKGRAFWWMMARLAGWGGVAAGALDLTPSYKVASTPFADYGQLVTYTVAIRSASGPATSTLSAQDSVPAGLHYVPDSLVATAGVADDSGAPLLIWSGVLTPQPAVTFTYVTTVAPAIDGSATVALPRVITNTVLIQADSNDPLTRTATLRTDWLRVFLPLAVHNHD